MQPPTVSQADILRTLHCVTLQLTHENIGSVIAAAVRGALTMQDRFDDMGLPNAAVAAHGRCSDLSDTYMEVSAAHSEAAAIHDCVGADDAFCRATNSASNSKFTLAFTGGLADVLLTSPHPVLHMDATDAPTTSLYNTSTVFSSTMGNGASSRLMMMMRKAANHPLLLRTRFSNEAVLELAERIWLFERAAAAAKVLDKGKGPFLCSLLKRYGFMLSQKRQPHPVDPVIRIAGTFGAILPTATHVDVHSTMTTSEWAALTNAHKPLQRSSIEDWAADVISRWGPTAAAQPIPASAFAGLLSANSDSDESTATQCSAPEKEPAIRATRRHQ